jgi:NAD(P)-dependent dehydrogenase (short-subunit alcohol dehydrogenase family)
MDLTGRTAVVIGGTDGMGLATARLLAAGGARVLVTGRDERKLAAARAALGDAGEALRSDVAQIAEIDALARAVAGRLAPLDALFLFAAIAELAPIAEVSEASFDRQFAVNTRGAFFALQRLAPLMRAGGAITVTTVTPATASPTMGVYLASKAAVRAFAQVLAAELLPRRIRVNALAPGFMDTPTLGIPGFSPEERAAFRAIGDQVTPMQRHGTPEEAARAALFLAFDATFTTGIELPVDGGLSQVDAPPA